MTLSEILANTPPVQTLAQATDVPGTNLEWMKTAAYPTGAWYGDLGELGTTGFRDSLFTGYLARGVTCRVSGVLYSWSGTAWAAVGSSAAFERYRAYRGGTRKTVACTLNAAFGFAVTFAYQAVVPATNIKAVRFALLNSPAGGETWTARVGCQPTYASGFGGLTLATSSPATWDNGESSKAGAASNPTAGYRCAYTWSDWIGIPTVNRNDGGPGSIITVLAYRGDGIVSNINSAKSDLSNDQYSTMSPYAFRSGHNTGNLVSNPSGFGSSAPNNNTGNPILAVEFMTDENVVTFAEYGDSISDGFGARVGYGPIWEACDALTAGGVRAIAKQSGVPGAASRSFIEFLNADLLADQLNPSAMFAFCRFSTPNDGSLTTTPVGTRVGYARAFVDRCKSLGIIPVLLTSLYETADPSRNAYTAATDAALKDLAALLDIPILDLRPAFNAGNAASYLGDGLHPNQAGQTYLVTNYYVPFMQSLIAKYKTN